jgi:hypothetical protein
MRYEGAIALEGQGLKDELIYFEGPDNLDPDTAERMVRDIFGETLMWFRPGSPPVISGWRDESHPFSYLIFKNENGSHLLQVLTGALQAWTIQNHCCGDPWNWRDELPNGLYVLNAVLRIKDNVGATDWNSEWIEDIKIRQLTGPELLKIKRGDLLC